MTKIHFLTEHTSSKAMELLEETLIFNSIFTSMTQVKWRTPCILTRFALFPLMHFHHVSLGQVSLQLKVSKFISFFLFHHNIALGPFSAPTILLKVGRCFQSKYNHFTGWNMLCRKWNVLDLMKSRYMVIMAWYPQTQKCVPVKSRVKALATFYYQIIP